MQKLLATAFLILAGALPGLAQDTPRIELFAGYTAVRANEPPGQCGCFVLNGGAASVAYNFNKWVGALGEFGSTHAGNINATGTDLTLTSYLFGPQVSLRKYEKFRAFGQFLMGGTHAGGTLVSGASGASASAFALTLGGGLDWNVRPRVAVRMLQLDYFRTGLPNGSNARQNNLRVGVGVVLRFGYGER